MDASAALETFFQDHLDQALRDQGIPTGTLTELYLVRLLAGYANHPIDDKPLALRLLGAVEAAPRERRQHLREIGDTSLYVSGFWSDSFTHKVVDVDYYIGVGESAYGELARRGEAWAPDPFGDVYGELARKFERFVRVLGAVSRRLMPEAAPQDVLRVYQKWTETRSRWAAGKLAALGIVVSRDPDERPQ